MDNDCLLLSIILLSILIYFFVLNNSKTEYYKSSKMGKETRKLLLSTTKNICYYPSLSDRALHKIAEKLSPSKSLNERCNTHLDCKSIHCHGNKKICVETGCVKP
jgi:hypothetical protein